MLSGIVPATTLSVRVGTAGIKGIMGAWTNRRRSWWRAALTGGKMGKTAPSAPSGSY